MKIKKHPVLVTILFLFIFNSAFSSADSLAVLDKQVVTFFLNTRNFHKAMSSLLERETFFYPSDYVVTLKSLKDGTSFKHYFDINYCSEYDPDLHE